MTDRRAIRSAPLEDVVPLLEIAAQAIARELLAAADEQSGSYAERSKQDPELGDGPDDQRLTRNDRRRQKTARSASDAGDVG